MLKDGIESTVCVSGLARFYSTAGDIRRLEPRTDIVLQGSIRDMMGQVPKLVCDVDAQFVTGMMSQFDAEFGTLRNSVILYGGQSAIKTHIWFGLLESKDHEQALDATTKSVERAQKRLRGVEYLASQTAGASWHREHFRAISKVPIKSSVRWELFSSPSRAGKSCLTRL